MHCFVSAAKPGHISMFINLYIARPIYHFILIYTCGLTVVIKRIRYVMLCYCYLHQLYFVTT